MSALFFILLAIFNFSLRADKRFVFRLNHANAFRGGEFIFLWTSLMERLHWGHMPQ